MSKVYGTQKVANWLMHLISYDNFDKMIYTACNARLNLLFQNTKKVMYAFVTGVKYLNSDRCNKGECTRRGVYLTGVINVSVPGGECT